MPDVVNGFTYGLRDVKLTTIDGGSQVDLPAARVLSWAETIVNDQLRGDDIVKAAIAFPEAGTFTLEGGGYSLEAYSILTGETVSLTGSAPNRKESVVRKGGQNMPYIKIYGKSLGDGDDDMHVLLKKAKVTSLEGNMSNQEFQLKKCSGIIIPDDNNDLYELVKNETATDLPSS